MVFTLPEEAEISEVGLVNGYAKKDTGGSRTVDWYPLNRRILKVEWVFDDGTTVAQDLRSEPVLQTIASTRCAPARSPCGSSRCPLPGPAR